VYNLLLLAGATTPRMGRSSRVSAVAGLSAAVENEVVQDVSSVWDDSHHRHRPRSGDGELSSLRPSCAATDRL